MESKIDQAERYLKTADIEKSTIEKLAEMLVTTMDGWQLVCDQQTAESVWSVLVYSARNDFDEDQFKVKFGENETSKRIAEVYQKYKTQLLDEMKSIRWDYDEVIDCSWNVAKTNKSSLFGSSCNIEPLATVNLRTLEAGQVDAKDFKITFDEVQLEDFVWKLKEAQNMVQNLRKK